MDEERTGEHHDTIDGIPKLPDPARGIIPPGRYWFDGAWGITVIDIEATGRSPGVGTS
jgi:hypothetical protein